MSKINKNPIGMYRTHDPIQEFKVKIRLKKISPLTIVTDKDRQGGSDEIELTNLMIATPYEEERVFAWQTKVFCRREINWYSNSANCTDFVDKKYHEKLKSSPDGRSITATYLFCYVDVDVTSGKFVPVESGMPLLSNTTTEENHVLMKTFSYANKSQIQLLPKTNIINESTAKSKNRIDIRNKPKQVMYIMADLNCYDESSNFSEENEKILCVITANSNGVITVLPDFSKKGQWYQVYNSRQEAFHYSIEHASTDISKEEVERERSLLKKIYDRHMELVSACLDAEFDLPPPQTFSVFVFGEIVSAKDFELDNLCIHYFFELPENWKITNFDKIAGITQTCATTVEGVDNVVYFAFPFEAEFHYKITGLSGREMMPNWPQLFIEVISFDKWERYCVEGYTYTTLPSSPGVYELHLSTWSPISRSATHKLRRFFVGGAPELKDLTYVGIPSTFDGAQLSRIGVETQSSGSVTIRLNVVHQSEIFAVEYKELKKTKNLLSHLESTSQNSISGILSAFQRARNRMLAARARLEHLH